MSPEQITAACTLIAAISAAIVLIVKQKGKNKVAEVKAEGAAHVAATEAELKKFNLLLDPLREQIRELKNEVQELRADRDRCQEEYAELKTKYDALVEENRELLDRVEKLERKRR